MTRKQKTGHNRADEQARIRALETERDALRRQLAQAEALQEISRALTSTLDLNQVLTLILELAGRVIDYDSASVLLVWPSQRGVTIVACRGFEADAAMVGKSFSFEDGNISAQVIASQQTLLIGDVQQHPGWARKRADLEGATTIRAWIGAPLVVDGESIGLLTFDKYTPNFYAAQDAQAASVFAAQVALAVRNARLFEQTRRRAEEMSALQRIGLDLAGRADRLESVLDLVLERVRELFHAGSGEIWLWDEALDALELVTYQAGLGPDMRGARLRPGEGFNGRVFASGQPLIVEDYAAWPQRVSAWSSALQHATVGVPMFWQGRKIGAISVSHSDPSRQFSPDDARLLELFANHAAAAITNARLMSQTLRRLAELEALDQVGRAISSTIQLDALMELIYHQTGQLMDTTNFYIALYDQARGWLDFAIEVEQGRRLPPRGRAFAGGLTEHILKSHQPLFVPASSQRDALYSVLGIQPRGRPARSWLGVPMIAGDHALGVIAVQSYERDYAYDEHDLRVLATIAAQAAVAVQNARLYAQAQRRAEELRQQKAEAELLYQAARTFGATLDAAALLEQLLALCLAAGEAAHGSAFLLDEQGGVTHRRLTRQDAAPDELDPIVQAVLERGLAGWVYRHAQPVLITDPQADERWLRLAAPYEPVGAVLCAPLDVRGAVRGLVTLVHSDPAHFTERHQRSLTAIAQQAATALENIHLFEQERRRAQQLALMHGVSAAVSSSLDIREVLQIAAARLAQLFDVDHCGVVLFDADLTFGKLMAEHPQTGIVGLRFPLGDDRAESEMIAAKRPVCIEDVETDPRLGAVTRATLRGTGVLSTLLVPLIAQDRIIGSFGLDARKSRRSFTAYEAELAQTIAAQIAIAADNARLYHASVTRVEQEMSIARHIQQNLFPRRLPELPGLQIAAVCRPARETGGDFYEFAVLGDRRLGVIVGDVSGKGLPAAMLMAAARSTARAVAYSQPSPARMLDEVNRLLCDDVPRGAFVAMSFAVFDLEQGRVRMANGGQVWPLALPATGQADYAELASSKLPLGVWPDLRYAETWRDLRLGDTIVFVTDGVLEAHNRAGEMFGFDRLQAAVSQYASLAARDLAGAMLATVDSFAQGVEQHDDITIVVVRWRAESDQA